MSDPVVRSRPVPVTAARPAGPRLPLRLLWRGRLAERLDEGVRQAVTLVCAGPGWGKTALAGSWAAARRSTGPIAWLACEPEHNRSYAFWSALVFALRAAGAVPAGHPMPEAGPLPAEDDAAFARRVAGAIATLPAPVVLVLDDLHQLTDERTLATLAGLVGRPGGRLRFVLLSRAEPGLPLHRERAAGELTEIRQRDLAFRAAEAAELSALAGDKLPTERLAELLRRTEGWGAGLRLAMDAPEGVSPAAAAEDYLLREVLDSQPAHLRHFLLRTSVADRICGDLADALTGQQHSQQILERLAAANLFVERTGSGRWFRYHPLFRAALRHRATLNKPGEVPRLHLLAAQWYSSRGDGLTALSHAATAGDWGLLGRLVVDHGLPLLGSADHAEVVEVLRRIPPGRLADTPELALCAAILRYADGDLAGVPDRLARARSLLRTYAPGYRTQVELAVSVLESGTVLRRRADMAVLVERSTQVLAELTRLDAADVPSLLPYRAIALNDKGAGLLWTGRFDHADRYLWAAASAARVTGMPLVEINALSHLALLAHRHGSLTEAAGHATSAREAARRIDATAHPAVAPAYLAEALIELERGSDAEAETALRRALKSVGELPETVLAGLATLVRARLLLDRGEPLGARAVLARAHAEAGPWVSAPLLDRSIDRTAAEIDIECGDAAAVVRRYASGVRLSPAEQVSLARAHLALGDHQAAEPLLARAREGSDRVAAVYAWVLTALAADAHGRSGRAADALGQALAAAEPDRIRRPFRRLDPERVAVLAGRQQWLTEPRGPGGDGVLAEITGEIPMITGLPTADPLSEREVDVLQFLPTVLTAAEIAESLGISVNTVKAHMRSIYRKLGAGRRREAVVQARQAGLL
ncbi:LuxR family transcriptional regulator [Paractinoplanes deccanensis]|uniref:LuxR family transcriptional regulator n=1 Tax=Paractinoplanes deccanensis TaxID=113561 RepID=A0ABQ3YH65_9ACTN|nr:LuxR C-terminal-related transcriptional regulator [Actinoplanes deccanensis]GID79343.1 LuxR family transcriptional regulator [Actinoplanes deccanensis]